MRVCRSATAHSGRRCCKSWWIFGHGEALLLFYSAVFNVYFYRGTARITDQSRCLFLPQTIHRTVDKSVGMPVDGSRSAAVSLVARRIPAVSAELRPLLIGGLHARRPANAPDR